MQKIKEQPPDDPSLLVPAVGDSPTAELKTTQGAAVTVETAVRIAPFYTEFLHVRSQTGCPALSQSLYEVFLQYILD